MSGPVQPPLTVETIDGTTSGRPITTIKVTNGDLTVSGNIATIDTSGGGGGGGMTSFDLAGDSGPTQSIGNGDTLSVLGGTGLASVASATDTVTLNIENTLVSGTTPNYYDALTINAQGQVTAVASGTAPQAELTLTTTGTSGAATLVGATLNIPQYAAGTGTVTSVGLTETGDALTITGSPVTTSGTLNIAGAGTSSQVILGDLTLGTKTSGTVTSITAGTGLDGGTITTSGTIDIADTAVTPGSYTNSDITVDQQGRITAASSGSSSGVGGSGTVGTMPVFVTDTTTIGDSRMTQPNGYETLLSGTGGLALSLQATDGNEPNLRFLNSSSQGIYFQQASDGGSLYLKPIGSADVLWKVTTGGAVTINDAYTLPTAVTGSNDYVLTAQTDGTTAWAAASATVTFPLEGTDGTAAAPTYSFASDDANGMYLAGTDTLGFATGGDARLQLSTTELKMGNGSENFKLSLNGSSDSYLNMQNGSNVQLYSSGGVYLNAHASNNIVRANAVTTILGNTNVAATLTTQGAGDLILSTNNGTDSGAIQIVDGANGNITINPDGTGTVGMGNMVFDVDQALSASEDGYVMTYSDSSGELSLREASGGGGYPVAMPSYADVGDSTYNVLASSPIFGGSYMTAQNVSNSPYHYPFIATTSGTVSAIAINVYSAVVGVNILVGIYDTGSDNLPDSRLGYATISAASTGDIEQTTITGTITLTAGTQYWVAWCKDDNAGTPQCQCTTNSASQSITSLLGLGGTPATANIQTIYTFDSQELPATFDSSTAYQASTGRLAVGVKF